MSSAKPQLPPLLPHTPVPCSTTISTVNERQQPGPPGSSPRRQATGVPSTSTVLGATGPMTAAMPRVLKKNAVPLIDRCSCSAVRMRALLAHDRGQPPFVAPFALPRTISPDGACPGRVSSSSPTRRRTEPPLPWPRHPEHHHRHHRDRRRRGMGSRASPSREDEDSHRVPARFCLPLSWPR